MLLARTARLEALIGKAHAFCTRGRFRHAHPDKRRKEVGWSCCATMDKLGQLALDKLSLDKVKNMVGEV